MIRTPPLIISSKTTRITGPLTANGQIDFLKAVEEWSYPPEFTTDDNGFRILTRLFGNCGEAAGMDEFRRVQKYEKLGLDPKIPPTMTLPREPREIVKDHFKAIGEKPPDDALKNLCNRPWTLDDFPILADWVKECDVPLDAVAETVRKPIFLPPLLQEEESFIAGNPQNLAGLLIPDVSATRTLGRLFQARAMNRIAQGNIDGAIDDKLTQLRLGRQLEPRAFVVQYLTGIAIQGSGYDIGFAVNSKHPPTKEQLLRLLDGIDKLPPRMSLSGLVEFERYFSLSVAQEVMHGRSMYGDSINPTFAMNFFNRRCNWNIVFRRVNELYDAVQESPPRTKYHAILSVKPSPSDQILRKLTPNGRAEILADQLIQQTPAFDRFEDEAKRSACLENIQRLTLAILLYRAENGKLPDGNWTEKIDPYLGKEPEKYFRCPTIAIPDGETTYALVQYDTKIPDDPDMILLVELAAPVPLDKAVVSVTDLRGRKGIGGVHRGGMNVGFRSGAVRYVSDKTKDDEFLPMLGVQR